MTWHDCRTMLGSPKIYVAPTFCIRGCGVVCHIKITCTLTLIGGAARTFGIGHKKCKLTVRLRKTNSL